MGERKALSKKVRFEVFKRDSFTCQYCGAKAPDVALQADHIKPVAEGGTDEILNLVTSCAACNNGKGARKLDDASAVEKQRRQLEALQERREQLDMILEWQRGLAGLKRDAVDEAASFWIEFTPGHAVTESGKQQLAKWIKTYGLDDVLAAMTASAETYLRFNAKGIVTDESWEKAFAMIPRVAVTRKAIKESPWMDAVWHAYAILRKRFDPSHSKEKVCAWIERAIVLGLPEKEAVQMASSARSWMAWCDDISPWLDENERCS